LLDGLTGAAAEQGAGVDRGSLEKTISSLGNRVFLLHDIHRPGPVVFQTRMALTFLRGPLTREQVSKLMARLKEPEVAVAIALCANCNAELGPEVADVCPKCGKSPWKQAPARVEDKAFRDSLAKGAAPPVATVAPAAPAAPAPPSNTSSQPPVLSSDVRQFFLKPTDGGTSGVLWPWVLGFGEVTITLDKKTGKEHNLAVKLLAPPPAAGFPVDWTRSREFTGDVATTPPSGVHWAPVPEALDSARKIKALEKGFSDHLYGALRLSLFENEALDLVSEPEEGEEAFRARCREAAHAKADEALAMEQAKFRPKFAALDMGLPAVSKRSVAGQLFKFAVSAVLQNLTKIKTPSQANKQRKIQVDYEAKVGEIEQKWSAAAEAVTAVQFKPRKADVRVTHFGVGWQPA
jgi:hypothetical protein